MKDIGVVKWLDFIKLVSYSKGFQAPKYKWRYQKARTYMKELVKLGFAKYVESTRSIPSSRIIVKGDVSFLTHEYVKDFKARFKTGDLTNEELSLLFPEKLKEYKNLNNIKESRNGWFI